MSDSGSSETTDRVERVSTRSRVLRPMRPSSRTANIILATRTREGCSAQKADSGEDRLHAAHGQVAGLWQTTEHDSGRRIRGSQQDPLSCEAHSAQEDAWHDGPEETAHSKTDFNRQIDGKFRTNGCRSLNADAGWQLSCKSRETRCSTARPGRVRQTRGDLGRVRRPEDLSGRSHHCSACVG